MISLPKSWMLIPNCSYRRRLIHCKIHEFRWADNSTCQIDRTALWESTQRQKLPIPTMMMLPKSWPLNRDGSCRRHLIHCKNYEFWWVNNSISEPSWPHCSSDYQHSGKSNQYLLWYRCQNPGRLFPLAPIAATCFKRCSFVSHREKCNLL